MSTAKAKISLHQAANGRLMLAFGQFDTPAWRATVAHLEQDLGFGREGIAVDGLDEGLLPHFVDGSVRLYAGYDNWSGMYLLAQCGAGEQLLRQLAERLLKVDQSD